MVKMNMQSQAEENLPSAVLRMLIARHGVWRILRDLAVALVRRDGKPGPALFDSDMSARLRRDVGLPPVPDSPRHWDIRL